MWYHSRFNCRAISMNFSDKLSRVGIVEFQAFKVENTFIIKELYICDGKMNSGCHFFFKPPYEKNNLSPQTLKNVFFCTRSLHGLDWDAGEIQYDQLLDILTGCTANYDILLTKGEEKRVFLQELLNRPVGNLDIVLFNRLENMKFLGPPIICKHMGNCALRNAFRLGQWFRSLALLLDV